jgi:uncharacterized protein DUF5996
VPGLTTGPVLWGSGVLEIELDFLEHQLRITTSRGDRRVFALEPMSVAAFDERTMATGRAVGIDPDVWRVPVEPADPIPFERDSAHASCLAL